MSRRPQPNGGHMNRVKLAILSFGIGLGLGAQALTGLFSSVAQAAEPGLTSTHRLLDVQLGTDGLTHLDLELAVHNNGTEALSGVILRPFASMPFLPEPQTDPVVVGFVGAGETVDIVWSAISASPVEGVTPLIQRLWFGAEADDGSGLNLGFPVESMEVAP